MILIHPHVVGQHVPLPGRSDRAGTLDADRFRHRRHQGHSHFRTLVSWTTMTKYGRSKPNAGQDGIKRSRAETYPAMLYGVLLCDNPKEVVSLTKAKRVPKNMREFLSWARRHYRIDVTASTGERKTCGRASVGACPGGCKKFSRKGFERAFHQANVQDLWYRSKGRSSSSTTRPSFMFSSTHGPQGKQRTHAKDTLCRLRN